jgi:hypothetical protein
MPALRQIGSSADEKPTRRAAKSELFHVQIEAATARVLS